MWYFLWNFTKMRKIFEESRVVVNILFVLSISPAASGVTEIFSTVFRFLKIKNRLVTRLFFRPRSLTMMCTGSDGQILNFRSHIKYLSRFWCSNNIKSMSTKFILLYESYFLIHNFTSCLNSKLFIYWIMKLCFETPRYI